MILPSFNILVTGANGMLGSELRDLQASGDTPAGWEWHFTTRSELDITNTAAVGQYCREHRIAAIINCAAYTAVDKAESEPQQADAINHLAVAGLARLAKEQHIQLVHLSTDYVFDGQHTLPYRETDSPNPLNTYGRSKQAGEQALLACNPPRSAIVRSGWLYSAHGHNFVKTVMRLCRTQGSMRVVNDQTGTPTHARDLARVIVALLPTLQAEVSELFHYSHAGQCTWNELAVAIAQLAGLPCQVDPINSAEYAAPAPRPPYSVLDHTAIARRLHLAIPHWHDALARHLTSAATSSPLA